MSIDGFLCAIGLHDWSLWEVQSTDRGKLYDPYIGNDSNVGTYFRITQCRSCKKCNKHTVDIKYTKSYN
jgi:hypothetical protein